MRYHALATDYDGTLAHDGAVDAATLAALERFRGSGRKLILVTGRELRELTAVFPHLDLFEWIVAENGAQLHRPANSETVELGEPPSVEFVDELRRRGVDPLSVGHVIVATREPHETTVLAVIRDLGLELKVIFNKGAVMVLPAHVNKATGLTEALKRLGLSPHEIAGVGDAENDHAFLRICECSAAVANALPAVKQGVDLVLERDHGAGVAEFIDGILRDDLAHQERAIARHQVPFGRRGDGQEVRINPYSRAVLVAGPSGSGKSTVATGLLERLGDLGYQFCVVDPEGDFTAFEGALVLGGPAQPPVADEVLQVLKNPKGNVIMNLVGVPLADRPAMFASLLGRLLEMRAAIGRPHWLVVDEAHHLLPTAWAPASVTMPQEMNRLMLVTVHPAQVSPAMLELVKLVVAVGPKPQEVIAEFCRAAGDACPPSDDVAKSPQEVLVWSREAREHFTVRPIPSRSEHRRHIRKYMEGELPPERSFIFRGPEGKLKLRAQNLMLFMQMADGVDDDTWRFHLQRHDVSRWFDEMIKDRDLSAEAAEAEAADLAPDESRARIKAAIVKRYTLPATSFMPMPGTDAKPQWS